jgi:hypothetical protein
MRINGAKLIGRIGDDYYFADSAFKHERDGNNGFQGVTGFIVRPVSEAEYEWCSDRENVAERLQDVYACIKDQRLCDTDVNSPEFEEFVDNAIRYDGIEHLMFDSSYTCDASRAFDNLGIEHECTDCSGCGRIFGSLNFDEVYDYFALLAINEIEAGNFDAESASSMVFADSVRERVFA